MITHTVPPLDAATEQALRGYIGDPDQWNPPTPAQCGHLLRLALSAHAAPAMLAALQMAVLRIELANSEGNPILSAWLPDALAAIAAATGNPIPSAPTVGD